MDVRHLQPSSSVGCSIITAGKSTWDGRSEGESNPPACFGVGFAVIYKMVTIDKVVHQIEINKFILFIYESRVNVLCCIQFVESEMGVTCGAESIHPSGALSFWWG